MVNCIRRHWELLVSIHFSISFLIFFSLSTTPLFYHTSLDSEVFQYWGLALLKGKTPYVDLFDHKGCILYLINAIGIGINKSWGLVFLQIIFLSGNVYLWLRTIKILTPKPSAIYWLVVFFFVLQTYFDGGNMSEEWSLLFISLPIYWSIQSISRNTRLTLWQLFLIGLCIGVVAFIRLNNIILIFGYLLFFLWQAIREKAFLYIVKGVLAIALGVTIPSLLCIGYFYHKEGMMGVEAMIYGTFVFNFEYISKYSSTTLLTLQFRILSYAPIVMMMMLSLLCFKKEKRQVIPLFLSYSVGLLVVGQTLFRHYFLVFVPLMVVTWGLLAQVNYSRTLRLVFLLTFIGASFNPLKRYVEHFASGNNLRVQERSEQFTKMISRIPIAQRDSIWNYNAQGAMDAFVKAEIVQCNRIIIPFHLEISEKLAESEKNKIVEVRPPWILLNRKEHINNGIDREYIECNYIPVDSTHVDGIDNVVLLAIDR